MTKDHLYKLGIDPQKYKIYVLKQGYLFPEFEPIAKRYIMLFSPGATEHHIHKFNYKHLSRHIFPLDKNMSWNASGKSI